MGLSYSSDREESFAVIRARIVVELPKRLSPNLEYIARKFSRTIATYRVRT